jgi:uncharacterized protein YgiM (DUF1202 family)
MENIVRVVSDYRAQYGDPLVARKGERLTVGDHDDEWPGWIRGTNASGKSAWVPESYLIIDGDQGTLLRDYNAVELSANAGEELTVELEESGWLWCRNSRNQRGWLPAEQTTSA